MEIIDSLAAKKVSGSRVLITGGAGFIGSYIVEKLIKLGAQEIIIIDNMVRGSISNIEPLLPSGKIRLINQTISDGAKLDPYFEGIDYCFHMAALRITQCVQEPGEAFDTMYRGSFNVISSCVKHKVKKIIAASSASIYGLAEEFPTSESHHPYNNRTLYGAAKMGLELMLRSFNDMQGLDYVALRFFNVYGPRMDTHGKYTEVLIRWYNLIREGKEPLIFGEGSQTMDFVYVDDVARACIHSLGADASDKVYNVASGVETSLKELCFALLKVMGSKLQPKFMPLPAERTKVEVTRRLADTSAAKKEIAFETRYSLDDGLLALVNWLQIQTKMAAA